MAKKLKKGRVYAMDVQEEKLSALQGRSKIEKIHNIRTVLCDLEEVGASKIPDNFLDVVLIPNVLFQAENKDGMIEEAVRILKPNGQLLIIDWLASKPFSPKEGSITPDEVKEMADSLDLSFKKEFAVGDYHYALLFTKSQL